jgi:hypothetical protein
MNANISASPSVARQLVERLWSRLENEKRELVLFLIELAEFDAKKLALELGHPSTLGCLMTELRLSESSACRRISAARMLARFPQIGGYLLSSRLTLMSLVALKDVSTRRTWTSSSSVHLGAASPKCGSWSCACGSEIHQWPLRLPPPWRQMQSPPRRQRRKIRPLATICSR